MIVFEAPLAASNAALLTGTVIDAGGRPVAGAAVQVVGASGDPSCTALTAADGTFSLHCAVSGRRAVRASRDDLQAWEIDDVELGPEREVYLNFMLRSPNAAIPLAAPAQVDGLWSRYVPNPTLFQWRESPITLRMLAIATAVASFLLGACAMIWVGRRFGVETRRMAAGEVGDMALNPHIPAAGQRVAPVAVAGARGASVGIRVSVEEIAGALSTRQYGLVLVALVVAPGLFAVFSLALATAMLVGHERYLLVAMLFVPAAFLLVPLGIGFRAVAEARSQRGRRPRDYVR